MSDRGSIFDYFPNDPAPVVDITGTSVGIDLQFPPDDVALIKVQLTTPTLPVSVVQAFSSGTVGLDVGGLVGLPSEIEQVWSAAIPTIINLLQSNAASIASFSLGDFGFPQSGSVRARQILGGPLLVDLWVPGITANLYGVIDTISINLTITADLEGLLMIFLQWPTAQVTPMARLLNATITPASLVDANKLEAGQIWWEAGNSSTSGYTPAGSPKGEIRTAESTINLMVISPPSLSSAATSLASAISGIGAAAIPLGLIGAEFSTDASSATPLTLTMTHPIDTAPLAYDPQSTAGPIWELFAHPTFSLNSLQVTAGGSLVVNGTNFAPAFTGGIGWTNTCSGQVVNSEIRWGQDGQSATLTTLSWTGPTTPSQHPAGSNDGMFIPAGPLDTTLPYTFQARNSDALTTTPYSDPVSVQMTGLLDLVLVYESDGSQLVNPGPGSPSSNHIEILVIGTVTPAADGTFVATVFVPGDAVAGSTATLAAKGLGQQIASIDVSIVGKVQPTLYLVYQGQKTSPTVTPGFLNNISVHGEGFISSGTVLLHLNSSAVASAIVSSDSTFTTSFTWPDNLATGDYTLSAVEEVSGKSATASLIVTQEPGNE